MYDSYEQQQQKTPTVTIYLPLQKKSSTHVRTLLNLTKGLCN